MTQLCSRNNHDPLILFPEPTVEETRIVKIIEETGNNLVEDGRGQEAGIPALERMEQTLRQAMDVAVLDQQMTGSLPALTELL